MAVSRVRRCTRRALTLLGRAWREPPASPVAPRGTWPAARRWGWVEVAAILSVLAIAVFLRAFELTTLPHGLHGDEAATGLEAQRILREGWIGLYSPLALGR